MKPIEEMSAEELAAFICQLLEDAGVIVTLTGGACVGIWSEGKYVSNDLDFIEEGPVPRRTIRELMKSIGFEERGKDFIRAGTTFLVGFPKGPLMVGEERITKTAQRKTPTGILRLITPTDCVKDRLAAFFYWNDHQSLRQAVKVAKAQATDLDDIRRWSRAEGEEEKFRVFEQLLQV